MTLKIVLTLLTVGALNACTTTPEPQNPLQDLILLPADPEENLEIDEQFLNKSQRVGSNNTHKTPTIKTLLNP